MKKPKPIETSVIGVRVSAAERRLIEISAKNDGRTVSGWIRLMLTRALAVAK